MNELRNACARQRNARERPEMPVTPHGAKLGLNWPSDGGNLPVNYAAQTIALDNRRSENEESRCRRFSLWHAASKRLEVAQVA